MNSRTPPSYMRALSYTYFVAFFPGVICSAIDAITFFPSLRNAWIFLSVRSLFFFGVFRRPWRMRASSFTFSSAAQPTDQGTESVVVLLLVVVVGTHVMSTEKLEHPLSQN